MARGKQEVLEEAAPSSRQPHVAAAGFEMGGGQLLHIWPEDNTARYSSLNEELIMNIDKALISY